MSFVVLSPHLDDAVLSFGGAIAARDPHCSVAIATVLAGSPPAWSWPTPFDNASGFDDSRVAVDARRAEDRDACEVLGAYAWHMGFLDGQYGTKPDEMRLRAALYAVLRQGHMSSEGCAIPLGLAHPDHRLVSRLARRAATRLPRHRPVIVYADLPAAQLWPGHVPGALRGWARTGWHLEPFEVKSDVARKREAFECYRSQLRFPELAWENLREERAWLATYEA